MLLKRIQIPFVLITLILIIAGFVFPSRVDADRGTKKLRLNWEAEDGAIKYETEIADNTGAVVLNQSTKTNAIEFSLPPGMYKFRLRVTNKFNKTSEWSDWEAFKIASRGASVYRKNIYDLGIKCAAGIPYFQLRPGFDVDLEDSYKGMTTAIGFYPRDTLLFKPPWIMKFIGLELESTYIQFTAKTGQANVDINTTHLFTGGNILIATGLNFPLNLIIRAGGGLALTTINYRSTIIGKKDKNLSTSDPYYRMGCALEISLFYVFIEGGVDYYTIQYLNDDFKALRYFCLAGLRL